MDSLQYDVYGSYSDASSGPRTPSPHVSLTHSPANFKLEIDSLPAKQPVVFVDTMNDEHAQHGISTDAYAAWHVQPQNYDASQTSLLGELYEHELPHQEQPIPDHIYNDQQNYPLPQRAHLVPHHDLSAIRRATYPIAHRERDDISSYPVQPFLPQDNRRPQHVYAEPLPVLDHVSQHPLAHQHSFHSLSHHVKLEDQAAPVIVPSQILYRSQSMDQMHQLPLLAHPPHPIQFTDDAASKETQYLRRRCTNCSQTEPPSWRRSTLNPGKIVCNKCGLYERTHLRPRPLRFDELRTGNKARKTKKGSIVKQEIETSPMLRRASVSSASSVHSSDWDDSISVASSGSAPPSSYNSPSPATFSLPLERTSQSPILLPNDGGIRLPNVDIASLSVNGSPQLSNEFAMPPPDYFVPQNSHNSLPASPSPASPPNLAPVMDIPDVSNWQTVPVDLPSPGKRGPSLLRTAVAV